jgi:UDP-glucose 4-epimerase
LVTGGAGFIGSHIVESLVSEGAQVTVYDDFSSGRAEWLDHVQGKIQVIRGNCLDYDLLLESSKQMDAISHQAAQLEIFRSLDDPEVDLRVNTIGSLNVLKVSAENRIPKIINASSACVYGQAVETPESEDHPKNPNWPYGVSKLAAEKYCEIFSQFNNLSVTSLRYGIVYGEREWYGRVLTVFLKRALQGEDLALWGGGNAVRDFVYVKDVVSLHNLCLKSISCSGAYNVSTGSGTTIRELASLVLKTVKSNIKIVNENLPESGESRLVRHRRRIPLELKVMVLDMRKANRDFGWTPKVQLREGIKRELDWIRRNPEAWEHETYRV